MSRLTAIAVAPEGADVELRSPAVGLWSARTAVGSRLQPGQVIGSLCVLGVHHPVEAPASVAGAVVMSCSAAPRAAPVAYGTSLLVLANPSASADAPEAAPAQAQQRGEDELFFCSPLSGRFYARPAPDEAAFVTLGEELHAGQTICLIEVMKTFNRVTYGGDALPPHARVVAILPDEGDDLGRGDPILQLEV